MEKLREFTEKYISIHCENYTEKEKTIVRNSIQIGYEFLEQGNYQDLDNQVKALSAVKSGLENSLLSLNSKVDNVIDIMKNDLHYTGSVDKKVTIGNCIQLLKNEFER